MEKKIYRFWGKELAIIVACLILFIWLVQYLLFEKRSYYPDGKLACKSRVEFLNGAMGGGETLDGRCHCYWPNGRTSFIGNFTRGKKHGKQVWFNDTGNEIDRLTYNRGVPASGLHVAYWPNGVTRLVETISNGMPVGSRKAWFDNGQLAGECLYGKNGANGTDVQFQEEYFLPRYISELVPYVKGEKDGEGILYRYDGLISGYRFWKLGKLIVSSTISDLSNSSWHAYFEDVEVIYLTITNNRISMLKYAFRGIRDFRDGKISTFPDSFAARKFTINSSYPLLVPR